MIHMKPANWSITRGFIEPEWGWYWNSAKSCLPMLEGQGSPRDLVRGEFWDMDDNTESADWGAQPFGNSIHLPGAGSTNAAVQSATPVNHNIGAGDFTILWYGRAQNLGGAYDAIWSNGSFAPALYIRLGSNNWGIYWGADKVSGEALPLADVYSAFVVRRLGTTIAFWRDGIKTPTEHTVSNSMANAQNQLGDDASTSSGKANCSLGCFSLHDIALSEGQIQQWSRDPFGPFRMDADVGVIFPVAPAPGGSIPIFRHHYNQMAASS